jgi:hypothetical protein
MSAPTLLDGSKSLDVEEEKIRKKNYAAFKHCEIIHEFALYYVLLFQVMGQHLLVFMEEEFFRKLE